MDRLLALMDRLLALSYIFPHHVVSPKSTTISHCCWHSSWLKRRGMAVSLPPSSSHTVLAEVHSRKLWLSGAPKGAAEVVVVRALMLVFVVTAHSLSRCPCAIIEMLNRRLGESNHRIENNWKTGNSEKQHRHEKQGEPFDDFFFNLRKRSISPRVGYGNLNLMFVLT